MYAWPCFEYGIADNIRLGTGTGLLFADDLQSTSISWGLMYSKIAFNALMRHSAMVHELTICGEISHNIFYGERILKFVSS